MSKITTTRDLAMTFYNEFIENGGDVYDPDSRFSKAMGEVDEILFNLLDFKTANDLEGKLLTMSCEDVEQHYVMGFEKALEVCRIVYNRDLTAEELQDAPLYGFFRIILAQSLEAGRVRLLF